jgi:formate-dependent nitrite reductase membrane component NrfD
MGISIDHNMNGQIQQTWRWMVAVYLFLGGVGAGAYAVAAIASLMSTGWMHVITVGLCISFPAVAIGSIFLMAHLGNPSRFFLAILRPHESWISRGTLFITSFMLVSLIHFAGYVWPFDYIRNGGGLSAVISVVGLLLALMVMLYTGALLGASKGIPFWRTGITPVLFMISGLVAGLFAVFFGVLAVYRDMMTPGQVRLLSLEGAGLILLELFVLFFFLHSAYRLPESRDSAIRVMKSGKFIIGDLIIGLLLPLILLVTVYFGMQDAKVEELSGLLMIAAIFCLIGGLLLRFMILSAGAAATMHASGFEFHVVSRPKEPKATIGMLPPN